MRPQSLIGVLCAMVAIALGTCAASLAAERVVELALVPDQVQNECGRSLSEVWGLEGRSIYLFRPGTRGEMVLKRGVGKIESASLSPDRRLIAYTFVDKYPPDQQEVWAIHTPSVVVVSRGGATVDSIPGGVTCAWSPSGAFLAAFAPREVNGRKGTLYIWSASDRTTRKHSVQGGREIRWFGEDTVFVGAACVARTTGDISTPPFEEPSPDGRYSLRNDSYHQAAILDHARKTDLTYPVAQVTGRPGVRGLGKFMWIRRARSKHLLAFTSCDSVRGDSEMCRQRCSTHIVDVMALRAQNRVDGVLVGQSGERLVLFDRDGLRFMEGPLESQSGNGSEPLWTRKAIDIVVSAKDWYGFPNLPHESALRTKTVTVSEATWIPEGFDNLLRVVRATNHAVLAEVDRNWALPGAAIIQGYARLVFLSENPLWVTTMSLDGGTHANVRLAHP